MKIVVADDLLEMRLYLRRLLVNWGHDVLLAVEDGLELVAAAQQHLPELIVTDIDMPNLDGDEAILRVWEFQPVPVILISAFDLPARLENHPNLPMLRYLSKPVIQGELRAALDSFESEFRCSL
ncbi:response regulator [Rubinisphaera sp. JC750]|uniref:response regulator n=1 Tax=Rubinisphaera sp. JC750 TaxID=2898658 RepID=UPI001F31E814|nr:response regulator [Rubinisphaera sp. JC750]